MIEDLLRLRDVEPPMGDLFTHATWAAGRSLWVRRDRGETSLPPSRIIHARVLRLPGRARLHRLGLRLGQGYHKCGSRQDPDWITGLRVRGLRGGRWVELLRHDALPRPHPGETQWHDLAGTEVSGVSLEVRRSAIDGGWTPWNLALSAPVLEGELLDPLPPRRERLLQVERVELAGLPPGVTAEHRDGEVRYRGRGFEVGFLLGRPGFSFLGLHGEDPALAGTNLLAMPAAVCHQGPRLHPVGAAPVLAPAVRCDLDGITTVRGGTLTYAFNAGGQDYRLRWTVDRNGLTLRARRRATAPLLAWHSAAWTVACRNSVAPAAALGRLLPDGETGALALPCLLHLPRFGTWEFSGRGAFARSDCFRAEDRNTLELKVGAQRTPEGLYRLPAGTFDAVVRLRPRPAPDLLRRGAPAVVRRALARTFHTALTYRADTGTLSNNGASMHCPLCLDTWSAVTLRMGPLLPGLPAAELLRTSLERWLAGGPGYAAGRIFQDGVARDVGDEYLMTDVAGLRGLGDYLREAADAAWYRRHRAALTRILETIRRRDLDGDGLIESPWRTGVSGTGQWSTSWFDVVSFGWKDAFVNAILHGALRTLAEVLPRFGAAAQARELTAWADRLRAAYRPAFWNPETGWFAGWRCREGRLHDHAFLAANGAAVALGLTTPAEGRDLLQRLLREAERVGMPDPALGVPGNLRPIPDADLADILQGYPMGYYQNGGRTHAQTRHVVMGLYRAGLTREGDRLLNQLCAGFAEARIFGGNQSGVDWRYWDDRPCGYEGLLTDQFGLLEAVLARWGRGPRKGRR
jgi:hypothetical protein